MLGLQQTTLARALGWTSRLVPPTPGGPENLCGEFQHTWWTNPAGKDTSPPDYLADHPAMVAAERQLLVTEEMRNRFGLMLCEVVIGGLSFRGRAPIDYPTVTRLAQATAAQHAEALLRTLDLWVASVTPLIPCTSPT